MKSSNPSLFVQKQTLDHHSHELDTNTFQSDLGNLVSGSGCNRRVIRTFNILITPLFAFVACQRASL